MPLQEVLIPFVPGSLDTKSAPIHVKPGDLVTLENMYYQRTGEVRKRYGYTQLGSSIGPSSATWALSSHGGRLLLDGWGELLAWSPAQSAWENVSSDFPGHNSYYARQRPVAFSGASLANPDVACTGGMAIYCWSPLSGSAMNGVNYAVIELATGHTVATGQASSTGKYGKLAASGSGKFFLFFVESNNLRCRIITPSTGATVTTVTLQTDINSDGLYDVKALGNVSADCIVCYRNSAGTSIKIFRVNDAGTITVAAVTTADTTDKAIGWLDWNESNGTAYVALGNPTAGVTYRAITTSTCATGSAIVVNASATTVRNITGVVFSAGPTPSVMYEWDSGTTDGAGVYSASALSFPHATLLSKAALTGTGGLNGRALLGFDSTSGLQPFAWFGEPLGNNYFLGAPTLYGLSRGKTNDRNGLSSLAPVTQYSRYLVATTKRTSVEAEGGTFYGTYGVVALDWTSTKSGRGPAKVFADSIFIPQAPLLQYDGQNVVEAGHLSGPEAPTGSQGTGGSITLLASHSWKVVFAYTDANGRVWRSPPSPAYTATMTGSNNRMTLTISAPPAEAKPSGSLVAEVYRTTNGGSIYYRCGSVAVDRGTVTSSYVDDSADPTIDDNEPLYTTGDVLDNTATPPLRVLEAWRGRLWGIQGDEPTRVWYSKSLRDGQGVHFNEALTLNLPDEDGDCTALGEMDDRLIIFKRSAIYVVTGDGPDDLGNNVYAQPEKVSTKVGCTEPLSVVKTPLGLFFKSPKGIYCLTRGLETLYVGSAVEAYNSDTVTSAVTVDDQNQVRFSTSNGRTLVYDWYHQKWSVYTGQAAHSATVWDNTWIWVDANRAVYKEGTATWSDNGSGVTQKLVTGWLSMAQLQGAQRIYEVRVFGEFRADHTVTIRLAYDNVATDVQSPTKTLSGLTTEYRVEVQPQRQQCSSIRVTVEIGGTSEGARIQGLAFLVGVQGGTNVNGTGQAAT